MNFKRYNKLCKAAKKAAKPSDQAPSPRSINSLKGPTTFVLTKKLIRKLKSLFKTKIFRSSKASVTVAHGGLATLEESIRATLDDAAEIIEEIHSVIERSSSQSKRRNPFDCNQVAMLHSPTTMAHTSPETQLGLNASPTTIPTQPSSPIIKRAELVTGNVVVAQCTFEDKGMVVQETMMPFDTRDILKDLDLVYPNLESDRDIPTEDDTTLGMVIINSQITEDNFLQEFEITENEEVLAELMQIRDELVFGRPNSADASSLKPDEGVHTTNESALHKPTTPEAKDIVSVTDRIVRIVHRGDYEITNAVYDQLIKPYELDTAKSKVVAPPPSIDNPKAKVPPECALLPLLQSVNLKHKRRSERTIATHTYIKSKEATVLDPATNFLKPFHMPPRDKMVSGITILPSIAFN
ncbi:hypothetical protein ABC855_g1444 [[Candida] zeylanoides]